MFTLEDILNARLLTESQESKSIAAAKKLVMQKLGYDEQQADEFVREKLRHDLPALRDTKMAKFILGATRMVLDKQVTSVKGFDNLNKALKYASREGFIDKFDRNLNGLSAQELYDEFREDIEADEKAEDDKIAAQNYDDESSDYDIVAINKFEEAEEYGDYTSWCVTHSRSMYNQYTSQDNCTFYFCLRHGYEDEPKVVGEGAPLDSYGLSMIAVRVRVDDGSFVGATCRWNHDHGGSDDVMPKSQLCEIVGVNFEDAFPPNPDAERAMSLEEYMEFVYEDSEPIVNIDDRYYELSQDREPNVTPEEFEFGKEGFEYYIYTDDNEYVDGSYEKNGVVASMDNVGAILKNESGSFDILCREGEGDTCGIKNNFENYKVDDNLNRIVAIGENGYYLLYCYDCGASETKEINDDNKSISNVDFIDGNANFVEALHNDGKWSVYSFNRGNFKMLFANEEPKGNRFTIAENQNGELTIACKSGRVYDIDGNVISGGKNYEVTNEIVGVSKNGGNFYKIINTRGECGAMSEDGSTFVTINGNSWFDNVQETVMKDIIMVKLDGLQTLVNLSIGEQICDFSSNVMFVDARKTDLICARKMYSYYGYNDDCGYKLIDFKGYDVINGASWDQTEWSLNSVRPLKSPYLYISGKKISPKIINIVTRESVFGDAKIKAFNHSQVYNGECYDIEFDDHKHALFDAKSGNVIGYFDHLFLTSGGIMAAKPMGGDSDYLYDDMTLKPIAPIDHLESVGTQYVSEEIPLARCKFADGSKNFFTLTRTDTYGMTTHGGHWLFKHNIQGIGSGYGMRSDIQYNGKSATLNLTNGDVMAGGNVIGNVNESAVRFKNNIKGMFRRMDEARKRTFMDRLD